MTDHSTGKIPKILHHIWLGGAPMPDRMVADIAGWKRVMPDYRIIRWDETNIDLEAHPFTARMHRQGLFAFASDLIRLDVLHRHGGVYLDTDMEVKKPFDPFLNEQCLWSFEYDSFLATCIIGAVPGHPFIKELMAVYDTLEEPRVNNAIVTEYFLDHFLDFRLNNKDQRLANGVRVVPKEYFVLPSFDPRKNFAQHQARNQWKTGRRKLRFGPLLRALLGEVLFYKLLNIKMNLSSDYQARDRARHRAKA